MLKYEIEIKEINREDQEFIKEMLFQAIHIREGEVPPSLDVLEEPNLKKYYSNICNSTDVGYIAIDKKTGRKMGAIWLRLFSKENKGWGYISDDIPELSMAVFKDFRGKKIGTLLIEHLLQKTSNNYPNISLSVDVTNRAFDLYKRFGFKEQSKEGESITMLLSRL